MSPRQRPGRVSPAPDTIVRAVGLILTACMATLVVRAYVRQPQTLAEVAGSLSASVGAYRIDQQAFDEARELFRRDQFAAAEAAFARADPARQDARTQFHLAYAFSMVTPDAGVPRLLSATFLFVLLLNTMAAATDRTRVLRSLMIIFGAAFMLKFVVLAALISPAGGTMSRLLQVLLEGVTLGALNQPASAPSAGYVAFFVLVLFLFGLSMLPRRRHRETRDLVEAR